MRALIIAVLLTATVHGQAQYDAAMRVHALFGSMTALMRRINSS